jgi:hypothetical protein
MLRSPAFWVIFLALGVAFAVNVSNPSGAGSRASAVADERPSLAKMTNITPLLREGTALTEIKGKFRKQGERFLFIEDSNNRTFKCLENMSLQRVASTLQDEDRKPVWLISAKITEFNEENFLMLDKAVRTR